MNKVLLAIKKFFNKITENFINKIKNLFKRIKRSFVKELTKDEIRQRALSCYFDSKGWNDALVNSSRSETDAKIRKNVYEKVFNNLFDSEEIFKKTLPYTKPPELTNICLEASRWSYVHSFAGFLSIERDMEQPATLLWYLDTLGVTDKREVLPGITREETLVSKGRFRSAPQAFDGSSVYTITTNKKLIPGTVELHVSKTITSGDLIITRDNGQGDLLHPPGVLMSNSDGVKNINYSTGLITFTVDPSQYTTEDTYFISGCEDVADTVDFGRLSDGESNRFFFVTKRILVECEPSMLVSEANLMAFELWCKTVNNKTGKLVCSKLAELYTKAVNYSLVNVIQKDWNGNTYEIDMVGIKDRYNGLDSWLDAFQAELIKVDTELAKRSCKGVYATVYVVGDQVANWFRKLSIKGHFVEFSGRGEDWGNPRYIDDLIGYYNGIPVLRHCSIASNIGYAIHKTNDGHLAPVIRGMFLPLNLIPEIGNWVAPRQYTSGIYGQEGSVLIVPELVQKFSVKEEN